MKTITTFVVVLTITASVNAQHAGDVLVGRSAANQLRVSPAGSGGYIPDANIKVLPPVSGLFNGFSDNNPGFDHIVADMPGIDFLTLQSGTQVRLELVSVDPACKAVTASFAVIDVPGERALLGGNLLHTHLTWLVQSDDPAYDPLRVLWRATFKLVDTGSTGYSESAPFTFYFASVACTRGDCNADTVVNAADIQSFTDIVLSPASKTAAQRCSADLDKDGYVTLNDVPAFVNALLAS